MIGGFVEARETDVADAGTQKEGAVHGVTWNLITRDSEDERLRVAFARNSNLHHRALGPLEHVGHFGGGKPLGGLVVHLDNDVARADAGVIRGRADVRRQDDRVIAARLDHHAHAVIFADLLFAEDGERAGIKEGGMRVENAKHAGDSTLVNRLVGIDRLGVVGLDDAENAGEVAHGGLVVVSQGGGAIDGPAVRGAQNRAKQQDSDNQH